ncbi:MAG: DoxX family protein, partial [Pseudomonadota bacterium]
MDMIKRYAPYLMCILPALLFVAAGGAKLAGVEAVLASFKMMGLPAWFATFIGGAEVAGGIGLLIPQLRRYAAGGLSMIMMGAVYFHVAYGVPSAIPSIVLFVLMVAVMVYPWHKLRQT